MGCSLSSGQTGGNTSFNTHLIYDDSTLHKGKQTRSISEAKLVLLGETGVGKSSLALRFSQGRFSPSHEVTIGAAFVQQTILFNDGNHLKLYIWDTGGQERFRAMAPLYYRDADGAIVVYDSSYTLSFEALKFWVSELRSKGPSSCCLIIAANKFDIADKQINSKAKTFCELNNLTLIECSAKTGENVGTLFTMIAKMILARNQTSPSFNLQANSSRK